ncbi:MAG: phosphotransferase [Clostridiales bacterium]|nr:phosphotransferase [Clostridiales bacterium]
MNTQKFCPEELATAFSLNGKYQSCYTIEHGHINDTFVLEFENERAEKEFFLIQVINVNVFKNPDELMSNIIGVTDFLRKKIADANGDTNRETLTVYPSKDGKPYYLDSTGRYWRCYNFITDAYTCDTMDSPEVFYNAGKAFGKFQMLLDDYPIETLFDTIPNFHNTVSRFAAFKKAVEDNLSGRLDSAREEVDFVLAREKDAGILLDLLGKGELPLRVTHNDTKLNNVMFDSKTHEGICVVDLDTVMPGLSLYDFGDSIRFGASTASEDEKNLSAVEMSLELYESYVKGYLFYAGKSLTENEIKYLPFSSKLMTYECGMRFLTDYLNGDTYFKTEYPEHNLVRCRTQFKLVADMEKKMSEMERITTEAYESIR